MSTNNELEILQILANQVGRTEEIIDGNEIIIEDIHILRKILKTSSNSPSLCKYAEKITFNDSPQNLAFAIGYNLSSCDMVAMDKTNILVAQFLKKEGYDGYYLLNLFPDVQTRKIKKKESSFKNYIDVIKNCFLKVKDTSSNQFRNKDLYIFWGSSVYLNNKEISALRMIFPLFHAVYTVGTEHNHHHHPGRYVSLDKIQGYPVNESVLNGVHYLKP